MQILITHVYSRHNFGDAAILNVLIKQTKKAFPGSKIIISTLEDVRAYPNFEGMRTVTSFFYECIYRSSNFIKRIINTMSVLGSVFIWLMLKKIADTKLDLILSKEVRRLIKTYQSSDLVIGVGGGYLWSKKDIGSNLALFITLFGFWVAKMMKRKTVLHSQSIGPFGYDFQMKLFGYVFHDAKLIMVRERRSFNLVRQILPHVKVVLVPDAAFQVEFNSKTTKKMAGINIGITARRWLNTGMQENYEHQLADFIDSAFGRNKVFWFMPQVIDSFHNDDDRVVYRRILNKVNHKERVRIVEVSADYKVVGKIYSQLDYMVGTRMHSVIFALINRVPSIGIEYDPKTSGIMDELGLKEYVIKIEDVTSVRLQRLIETLQSNRKIYLNKLNNGLKVFDSSLKQMPEMLKQGYQQN